VHKHEPRFIEVRGRQIHYDIIHPSWLIHDTPLLVFLHEGLGSIGQWKDFPTLLSSATKCPALVYDRYGYGKSESLTEPRYARFLHDEALLSLPELLAKLGLGERKQIIVGHSDGGSIALIYASEFISHVAGVIVEAAHVLVEEATLQGLIFVSNEFKSQRFRELLGKYHGDKLPYLVESWIDNWMSPASIDWNIEGYLPAITCPVLAIQGTEDHFGSYAQLDSIQRKTAGHTEIMYIDGCGHIPHKQEKELVLKRMSEFIFDIINP
jgi:pimeloyl-ACP methyl ester carboxylesterase